MYVGTCWKVRHVAYERKHVPFSLYIIFLFQFKAEINDGRNNTALRANPIGSCSTDPAQRKCRWGGLRKKSQKCTGPVPGPTVKYSSLLCILSWEKESWDVNFSTGFVLHLFGGRSFRKGPPAGRGVSWPPLFYIKLHVKCVCGAGNHIRR